MDDYHNDLCSDGADHSVQNGVVPHNALYGDFHDDSTTVLAYCSKNMITSDILSLLGAHQMWSI